ncbi:DUF6049 family protein [Tomitella biformata]|uniref:DUF6049 family protein n=1 Tax=Tomitella biformata TaxID=630403 RepID=UPI0004B2265A|nr:DUF6049 family protein [Tomitella biformata]
MSYRTTRSSGLRHALRRAATAVAAAALLCGPAAGVATAAGAGTPAHQAPAHQAPADPSQQFLHLSIDSVTPQIVEPGSPATVTVIGSVANIGDRGVSDVQVRLQRANRIDEPEGLRGVLQLDQGSYDTVGEFHQITAELEQGTTAKFALSLPLRATTEASLNITEPGVYPLLVNVNGTPDYGGPARLDDARFLLPVLGLPAARSTTAATSSADAPDEPAVLPRVSSPVPMTMLYPLANAPKLAAGIPGQPTVDSNPVTRLIDDSLADSLAAGGRLHGMLDALQETVTPDSAAPDPAVTAGLCLAIDPDLLVTVDAMTHGYLVTSDPTDPTAPTTPGTGQEAATNWLSTLRTLAGAMCTVAMPYAQAELGAVTDAEDPQLTSEATTAAADIVNNLLGTTGVTGMLWPATGQLNTDTANALPTDTPTTLLLAANATSAGAPAMRLEDVNPLLSATSFDLPAAAALAATGEDPATPTFVPEDLRYRVDNDSRFARLQDALGAIVWPMIPPSRADSDVPSASTPPAPAPSPVILTPPQLWSVDEDEATAVLSAYARLIANGLAISRPLPEALALAKAPDAPVAGLVDSVPGDGVGEVTAESPEESGWTDLAADVRTMLPRLDSLRGILVDVPNAGLTPDTYLRPLTQDLLRSLSTANLDGQDPQPAEAAARTRLAALDESLTEQFQAITVLSPGSVYTLASSQSPLLLVAKNDLPIAVRVRLEITAPEGVNIHNFTDYTLPARGSRQIQVPAEIEFSRQIDLRVGLLAPDGSPLGEEIHISLHSNAYGNLIPIVTAVFGALLLLLAGRRAWHRIKGKPDPSDERRPVITPPDQPGAEG